MNRGIGIVAPEVDVLIWFGSSVMSSEEYRQMMYDRCTEELAKLNSYETKYTEIERLQKKYAPTTDMQKPQQFYLEQGYKH